MVEENSKKRKPDTESGKASEKKLTNRQKRKKLNEKNKWPQHPKIQSMDQRAKAYIRVAGLGSSTKAKETIDPKLDLMSAEVKFGRLLGGTDQRKRHAAVNKLKAYLRARCDIQNENGGISELDLLKLWKGLWYTLYMADKVPVQDELSKCLAELLWCVAGTEEEDEYAGQAYLDMCEEAEKATTDDFDEDDVTMEEIVNTLREEVGEEEEEEDESEDEEEESNEDDNSHDHGEEFDGDKDDEEEEESVDDATIPHCRGAHLASMFIRTFFRTIRREWGKMDKYRVDKFYTLIRMYMHEVFKYMATRHWNLGIIRLFNDAIFEEVLNQTPNGLRYHLIDITLDELAKANAKAPMQLTEATFLDALEPYFAMCQTGAGDDTIQHRVLEKVGEKFIEEYSVVSDKALEGDDNDDEGNAEDSLIFEQVHVGSVAQFIFELASDPETKDRYRKSLYELHKKYMRRVKKAGTDVELHEDHDYKEEDDMQYEIEDIEGNEVDEEADKGIGNETEAVDKKGKKKKKKEAKAAEMIEEDEPVDDAIEGKEEKKKKKKKKSKKDTASADYEEETLTISLSEQKKATAESKKKRKSKTEGSENGKAKGGKSKSDGSSGRRVKFTSTNRSKSFKASMKALVTSTPPKTSIKSPEKSILRGRLMPTRKYTGTKHTKKATGKAGRKRAVNYF
jgi:hypothetical protein